MILIIWRLSDLDPVCGDFREIQLVQNKLLRQLNGTKVKDKISTVHLLNKFGMLPVNQLNDQVKLLEIWKALNVADYPLKITQQQVPVNGISTRAAQKGRPIEIGKSTLTQNSSTSDAIRIWNQAPNKITGAQSLYQAKREIKIYVQTLPV